MLRAQSEVGEGVLVVESARIVYANEAAVRLLGYASDKLGELDSYLELVAPEHRGEVGERLASGATQEEPVTETVMLRHDGSRMPVEVAAKTFRVGRTERVIALIRDISAKKASEAQRLELAREQAARLAVEDEKQRWQLLARLGEQLAASLDHDTRLRAVPESLVPSLGDWCALHVTDAQGDVRLAAVRHVDPERGADLYASHRDLVVDRAEATGVARILESGEPFLVSRRRELGNELASGSLAFLSDQGVTSLLLVPLAARGRIFGTLLLAMAESGRRYEARDVGFVDELGRRVALSLDNARLHAEAESAVAARDETLQNLRKNLGLVQSIVEGSPDPVFVKDLQGRYIVANSAFTRAARRPLADVLGHDDSMLQDAEAAALSHEHDRLVTETGEAQTFEESSVSNGIERTMLVSKAPYRDSQGRLLGIVGIARDITARKDDERRLAAHAAQQEAVAEIGQSALAGIQPGELFDRATRLVADIMGADFVHVFELVPAENEMLLRAGVGWAPADLGHARVRAGSESHAGHTLGVGAPVVVEDLARETRFRPSQLLSRNGVTCGVMVPIRAAAGPFGVLGAHSRSPRHFTSQDVLFLQAIANVVATAIERARVEKALRQSEERLRTLVMGAPVALMALDAEGRFVLCEGSGLENLGLLPDRVLGRTPAEAAPGLPELSEQARLAAKGGATSALIESNGRAFEVRFVPARPANGDGPGAIGVATDVTARRRAERRREIQYSVTRLLSEAESVEDAAPELLRRVAQGLGWDAGVAWLESDGARHLTCAASWQPTPGPSDGLVAASRAQKLSRGEDVAGIVWSTGRPVWVHDATRERSFKRSAAAARDGLRTLASLPILGPRDVHGVLEFYSTEPRELDEDLLRLLESVASQFGLFIERRLAVLEVQRLNAELERRVGQRTRELEAANRELEAFSYSVSHDLRAPLRTIDGFSKALLEDHSKVLDEEGKHLLGRVRAGTQRMAQLTDDLLKLSRITRGELQRAPVDLGEVVGTVLGALRQQEPQRNVEARIEPGHVVQADPALLRVVMDNLVGNAWKFTRGRDVARIEFGAETRDHETVFFVRDNGAGFDMAYANKLFVPFQRLHRAAEFEGSGIGLATVQRVIQRHGGRIWAEGAVNQGATVYFTLPPR